jgi:hypothetical protein
MGQCAVSGASIALAVALGLVAPSALRSETVYEFATSCHEDQLNTCFNLIRERLDRLKAKEQGRAFCLPRSWGTPGYISSGYPISVLEHIRLSVSAARFGNAEEPVDLAMRDILKAIYPCD